MIHKKILYEFFPQAVVQDSPAPRPPAGILLHLRLNELFNERKVVVIAGAQGGDRHTTALRAATIQNHLNAGSVDMEVRSNLAVAAEIAKGFAQAERGKRLQQAILFLFWLVKVPQRLRVFIAWREVEGRGGRRQRLCPVLLLGVWRGFESFKRVDVLTGLLEPPVRRTRSEAGFLLAQSQHLALERVQSHPK